ncbi:MAG: pilus assembly protein FilA, partial [Acinetobacter tjernbergiae]
AASIGDVEVQGMQTYYNNGTTNIAGSVITISGH